MNFKLKNKHDRDLKYPKIKGPDTPERFFTIFSNGDNFCDFLFALLHIESLQKRTIL